MMSDELRGILGLCRRAGKISIGHDAAVAAIKKRSAVIAVTCNNASERLKKEIADECGYDNRSVKYFDAEFSMDELGLAIGKKAAVFTVDDENLAKRLYTILTGGHEYDEKI